LVGGEAEPCEVDPELTRILHAFRPHTGDEIGEGFSFCEPGFREGRGRSTPTRTEIRDGLPGRVVLVHHPSTFLTGGVHDGGRITTQEIAKELDSGRERFTAQTRKGLPLGAGPSAGFFQHPHDGVLGAILIVVAATPSASATVARFRALD
jgi:hypothetical protein